MFKVQNFFRSKVDRAKQDILDLRCDRFWAFSKEWEDEIDKAIATNDGDRLIQLHDALKLASEQQPLEFPLFFIIDVPREIEELFAKQTTSSDHVALHCSLATMTSLEQEKVVKALIRFWFKRSPNDVPNDLRDWAIPKVVKREIPLAIAEIIPHGAIAEISTIPVQITPRFTIEDPDEKNTNFVKGILLQRSKVRFIGEEGSGKTSKARWLCRERMSLGHQIYWINPHLKAEDKQKLEACNVTIVGGGRDYQAIANFCTQMAIGKNSKLSHEYARYSSEVGAVFEPVTIVLDELTNYKEEVGEPIEKLIKASMQEFSKINWHTIYIAHNDTLSCMGAPAGTANLIKSSVFDLRLEADPSKGNRIPKAIAKYRMPNSDDWLDVKIPIEWQ